MAPARGSRGDVTQYNRRRDGRDFWTPRPPDAEERAAAQMRVLNDRATFEQRVLQRWQAYLLQLSSMRAGLDKAIADGKVRGVKPMKFSGTMLGLMRGGITIGPARPPQLSRPPSMFILGKPLGVTKAGGGWTGAHTVAAIAVGGAAGLAWYFRRAIAKAFR